MIRPRLSASRVLLCAAILPLLAGSVAPTFESEPAQEAQPATIALTDVMESLKDHLKFIAQNLSDPAARPQTLERVHDMQRLVWLAKTMTPGTVASLPEPERSARQLLFRRRMNELLAECCRLEIHLIDGQAADAWNIIKGPLLKMREDGHELYQPEDD